MDLILEPFTLIADFAEGILWKFVDDLTLSMPLMVAEAAYVLVAVCHVFFALAVALTILPVTLVVDVVHKGKPADAMILVIGRIEIPNIVRVVQKLQESMHHPPAQELTSI